MNLTEKLAYIKGLCEGLELSADTKEAKILLAVVDLLDDLTEEVSLTQGDIDQIFDELDAIDEDLTDVEDALLYDDEEEECECHHHHHPEEERDCCSDDFDEDEDPMYEVTCPNCGETVVMDEDTLLSEDCACPNCGTPFEIEFDEDEDRDTRTEEE